MDTPEPEAAGATLAVVGSSAGDEGKSRGAASAPPAATAKLAARRRATFRDVDDIAGTY